MGPIRFLLNIPLYDFLYWHAWEGPATCSIHVRVTSWSKINLCCGRLNKCGLLNDARSGMSSIKVALCCKLFASLVLRMGAKEMEIAGPRTADALVTVIGAMARRLCTVLPTFLIGENDLHLRVNTFAASYLNTQGLNNSCLKSLSVDLSRSNFSIARSPLFQLKSAM